MARAVVEVRVADLPMVKETLEKAAETIQSLRHLLQAWEPSVRCAQCGQRYSEQACGPTHAFIYSQVHPGEVSR